MSWVPNTQLPEKLLPGILRATHFLAVMLCGKQWALLGPGQGERALKAVWIRRSFPPARLSHWVASGDTAPGAQTHRASQPSDQMGARPLLHIQAEESHHPTSVSQV